MRARALPLVLAAVLSLAAKQQGCSGDAKCAAARELVTALCKGSIDPEACAKAMDAATVACGKIDTPPPPPPPATCADGFPPGPDGCAKACPEAPVCRPGEVLVTSGDANVCKTFKCVPETPPPAATCEPLPGPVKCFHKGAENPEERIADEARGFHEGAFNRALDAACAKAGVQCGSGEPRPGNWKAFIFEVAKDLRRQGLCVTYDYLHGDNGRASEYSVRHPASNEVETFQGETTRGLIRRAPGAYRGICVNGGEGQPIEEPAAEDVPPHATAPCAPALTGFRDVQEQSRSGNRRNINTTPETCDSETGTDYCARTFPGRKCCPVGPGEGPGSRREACERELVGDHVVVSIISGGIDRVDYNEKAPMMAAAFLSEGSQGGRIRICAQKEKAPEGRPVVCTEAEVLR